MTHTDTDIAEILQRFDEQFMGVCKHDYDAASHEAKTVMMDKYIKDFIARECLALKMKWEREHFDNQ